MAQFAWNFLVDGGLMFVSTRMLRAAFDLSK